MKDLLIETLKTFEYPVKKQGSINKDEPYHDSFFTFWENDTYDNTHYDNNAMNIVGDFDVNFYSIDPELVETMLIEVKKKLKEVGFIISGHGYDVASDEPTHTGKGINALKIEKE